MRLLVDNALSHKLVYLLKQAGHDVIHLRDRLPVTSPDRDVFQLAQKDDRIILSADTDFGALLANHSGSQPSFILLRHDTPASPDRQAKLVEKILETASEELRKGSIISVNAKQARVRRLPLR